MNICLDSKPPADLGGILRKLKICMTEAQHFGYLLGNGWFGFGHTHHNSHVVTVLTGYSQNPKCIYWLQTGVEPLILVTHQELGILRDTASSMQETFCQICGLWLQWWSTLRWWQHLCFPTEETLSCTTACWYPPQKNGFQPSTKEVQPGQQQRPSSGPLKMLPIMLAKDDDLPTTPNPTSL